MDEVRKLHNEAKRKLIRGVCRPGLEVLDVGCGQGGDFHKWSKARVFVHGIDPSEVALQNAQERIEQCNLKNITLQHGILFDAPEKEYDIVCFNFSLQYSFNHIERIKRTFRNIRSRLKIGGKLIGTMFDSQKLLTVSPNYVDKLGNRVIRPDSSGHGECGEMIDVFLVDTPYYANGPVAEPIAYRDFMMTMVEVYGFVVEKWEPLIPYKTDTISDLYCQYIIRRIR